MSEDVWLIYADIVRFEYGRMRGRNQYNHIYRMPFEISLSRASSECIDIGGSPKNFRSILNYRY
jgi:hypothetical protein